MTHEPPPPAEAPDTDETARARRSLRDVPLLSLLPNLITLAAICAGLSALRFAILGQFEVAVILLIFAALLDGMDGRLARLFRSESAIGAELDSLADFLNFGVAPPLVIYLWALRDLPSLGWIAVLIFAVCAVLRLARFNVAAKTGGGEAQKYFVGVPAPAGAMLCLLPLFASNLGDGSPVVPLVLISLYQTAIAFLMISRLPTWSLKSFSVPRGKVRYLFVGFVVVISALVSEPWATLVVLDLAYLASLVWAWRVSGRRPLPPESDTDVGV